MVQCVIKLYGNEAGVYNPGQQVTGTVTLQLDAPKKVRALSLLFYGFAKCQWTESRKDAQGKDLQVNLTGTEVYINSRIYLFGSEGGRELRMAIGNYDYDFTFQIPPMIPSSYEATRGHIRYDIEANLDTPWTIGTEFRVPLKIIRKDDLNAFPILKRPAQTEYIKTFCYCFCKSSPLILTVKLSQSGYVPGQTMTIDINYNNGSSTTIERTRVALNTVRTYNSHTPEMRTVTESEKAVEVIAEGVNANESKNIQAMLTVPLNVAATNNYYCRVVQVAYQLKVCAEREGCYVTPIELTMAISVGTIPLNMNAKVRIASFQLEDHQDFASVSLEDDACVRLLE